MYVIYYSLPLTGAVESIAVNHITSKARTRERGNGVVADMLTAAIIIHTIIEIY